MAKWKSAFDADDEPEAAGGDFAAYDGPDLPFNGVFPFKIKLARMKKNRNKDDMIFLVLNVHAPEPDHDKHKYHGAPLFVNLNQTDQGKPYTKAMLDALGIRWKDFVTKTILDVDESDPTKVTITRLGGKKMDGEVMVRVSLRKGKGTKEYPAKADVGTWLPYVDPADDEDGDYEPAEDDGSAPPF